MVPREKLDQVCVELDHALRREQRAQELLREQSQQLNDLGTRVDLHTTIEHEKDASLTDAVQVHIFTYISGMCHEYHIIWYVIDV